VVDATNPVTSVTAMFDSGGVCGLQLNNDTSPFAHSLNALVCPDPWTSNMFSCYTATTVACAAESLLLGGALTMGVVGAAIVIASGMTLLCVYFN